jgi:predicted metal-binding membrane protein
MMVAMMLPSLVPTLSRYRRAVGGLDGLTALGGAGYFFVWTIAGACVYPFGIALGAVAMGSEAIARTVPLATGVVLMLAGLVQLTAWKSAQLARCRNEPACGEPLGSDRPSAWRYGCRFGLHCARCCSTWMAVLLVTGVMDVGVMAVVATAITAERWSARPERIARAAGLLVVAAGVVATARAVRTG